VARFDRFDKEVGDERDWNASTKEGGRNGHTHGYKQGGVGRQGQKGDRPMKEGRQLEKASQSEVPMHES